MFSLSYRGVGVDTSTYCLEWKDDDGILHFIFESDELAYNRLCLKAFDEKLNGYIVYPLTRSRLRIENGIVIKRGRKKTNTSALFQRKVKFDGIKIPDGLKKIE
jgi:hypothetical protein